MSILLAKRPRSHGQGLAGTLSALRYYAEVIIVEPDATREEARKVGLAKVESALETHECPGGLGCGR